MAVVLLIKNLIILFITLHLCISRHCEGVVVYVTPTPPPNADCPHDMPCHTLQHFFNNESFLQQSDNLTMNFINGEHIGLCKKTAIKSTSFSVIGIDKEVTIMCSIVELVNATEICIENVTLDHCYISSPPQQSALVFHMLSVVAQNQTDLHIRHARNVSKNSIELYNCTFKNSTLSGMLHFNEFGSHNLWGVMNILSSTISLGRNTAITFNLNKFRYAAMYLNLSTVDIENAQMSFINNQRAILTYKSTLNIVQSNMTFENNAARNSGGGAWYIYNSTINVVQSTEMTFIKNKAIVGGAIYLKSSNLTFEHDTRVVFKHNSAELEKSLNWTMSLCTAFFHEVFYDDEKQKLEGLGGAIRIAYSTLTFGHNTTITFIDNSAPVHGGAIDAFYNSKIIVDRASSVTFVNNSATHIAGAVSLTNSTFSVSNNTMVAFIHSWSDEAAGALSAAQTSIINIENNANVTFTNNEANIAGAILLISSSQLNVVNGADVFFRNNQAISSGGAVYVIQSSITIRDSGSVEITNNSAKSAGGGIFFLSSQLLLKDKLNMTFVSNSAARGGGMVLSSSKMKFLSTHSPSVIFENNSATEFGGAIYVDPDRLQHLQEYINYINCTYAPCLYYNPSGVSSNNTRQSLYFHNNSANKGGSDVSGASLTLCNGNLVEIENNTGPSHISGRPTRVCKCTKHHQPKCHDISYIYIVEEVYPSESFTIPVVVVGGDWGTTIGTVFATFTHHTHSRLKPSSQYTQVINSTRCTNLSYNVYSDQSVQMLLSVDQNLARRHYLYCTNRENFKKDSCRYFSPLYINLTVLPCPPGFILQGDPPGCNCHSVLSDNGVKCSIEKGKTRRFSWMTAFWMNVTMNNTVYSENCPFGYCKEVKTVIEYDLDGQCAFNHFGRLCGSCKVNYSRAIGSSHCIHCRDSNGVALLVFFVAAGFLLVLFIGVLNLTVSEGLINGFIFYANIVWKYQTFLFPEKMHNKLFFLKTFIAWLNLDFGIEMCFIKDLNAYWKTWLRFVFPLYIWSIAGLMIALARYSIRVTNLLGNRAVPILATLFLLSYTKLLQITVDILHFSVLTVYQPEGNTTDTFLLVWSVDGALDFFKYPHILLVVTALLTLLFLWLPYTLLLLCIQWLRRISHLWIFKWTTRFNPFYDAYFAPLKPDHQYWFGVLLLARGVLFITFASNFAIPQDINLLLLLIIAGTLLFFMFWRRVYKSHSVMTFYGTFLLNLCLLSGFIIFAHTKRKVKHTVKATVVGLSTGIVFLQFCCVIFYRICFICHSYTSKRKVFNVQENDEQVRAILDISARLKGMPDPAEIQPLLVPDESDNNDMNITPTY